MLTHTAMAKRWPSYVYFSSTVAICDGRRSFAAKYLSNFRELPTPLKFRGQEFRSIEHAFQAAKYLHTTRPEIFDKFAVNGELGALTSGSQIKKAGGKAAMKKQGVSLDVEAWDKVASSYMAELIRARRKVDKLYRQLLIGFVKNKTRLYHMERSGKKSYWGGFFPKGTVQGDPEAWVGGNELGKLLLHCAARATKKPTPKKYNQLKAMMYLARHGRRPPASKTVAGVVIEGKVVKRGTWRALVRPS